MTAESTPDFEPFDALSFDCYGTLIDWETGIGTELFGWAQSHNIAASRESLVDLFASLETGVQSAHPSLLYPAVLAKVLAGVGDHFGVAVTREEAVEFGGSVGRWPAFTDSVEALRRLQERFRLIILSNVDRSSFARSNDQLEVEFDLIVTAEDVGAYKPSDASFPAMLARLGEIGVDRSQLLHVAQSLYHDHEPARRVGLPSVWIDRRHAQPGFGATPAPVGEIAPQWRYRSMAEFADAALGVS